MADNSTKANLIAKILFIAGGIILFIVLVLFMFRIVPVVVSNISNFGTSIFSGITKKSTSEEIQVSTDPEAVNIKTPVRVSFTYEPKDTTGQYFVSYNCVEGVLFDIQSKDGPKRIICNTPLNIGNNINSISLIPLFTKSNSFADSIITISYKDTQNNTIASGSKTITIKGDENASVAQGENPYAVNGSLSGSTVTTTEVAPTTQTSTTQAPATTYKNPTKDLVISYIAPTSRDSSFVMHVHNYGNTSTGPWDFSYTDAENPSRTVISPVQGSLKGGQGLAVTVNFDGQYNPSQTVFIQIDPYNKIMETNDSNNTGSVVIFGDSSNNNYSYHSNDDADLIITDMEVGRMSGNRFVEDDEIDEDDTAAVLFVVKNQGDESTGSWRFEITNLPYDNDDDYRSKTYSSLRPGESLKIITEFDGIDTGRYSIKVEVDSNDDVDEEKENNNTKSETLEVTR